MQADVAAIHEAILSMIRERSGMAYEDELISAVSLTFDYMEFWFE